MFKTLERIWAIAKKDIRIYYLKGPVMIFGLLIPLSLYLAYALGRSLEPAEAFSSIIAMSLFFTATAVGPVIAPWETRSHTLERLISAPVSMAIIITGDALASAAFGSAITLIATSFGLLVGLQIFNPLLMALNLLISSLCFSFFGLLLSSPPTDIPADVMMISTLLKFPMVFISGIFLPLNQMPELLKHVALLSPLTYTTEVFRYSVYGEATFLPIHVELLILTGYMLFFIAASIKLHERSLHRRI